MIPGNRHVVQAGHASSVLLHGPALRVGGLELEAISMGYAFQTLDGDHVELVAAENGNEATVGVGADTPPGVYAVCVTVNYWPAEEEHTLRVEFVVAGVEVVEPRNGALVTPLRPVNVAFRAWGVTSAYATVELRQAVASGDNAVLQAAVVPVAAASDGELVSFRWPGGAWTAQPGAALLKISATVAGLAAPVSSSVEVSPDAGVEVFATEWSTCDVGVPVAVATDILDLACGEGWLYRQVGCRLTDSGQHVGAGWCEQAGLVIPPQRQACSVPCDEQHPSVTVGEWGACSSAEPCLVGSQSRVVDCQPGPCPQVVLDAVPTAQQCTTGSASAWTLCGSDEPLSPAASSVRWLTGAWGPCVGPCGEQWQNRAATCVDSLTDLPVPVARCHSQDALAGSVAVPASRQPCPSVTCADATYVPLPWGKCSAKCGLAGVSTRELACYVGGERQVTLDACANLDKPPTRAPCNRGSCALVRTGVFMDDEPHNARHVFVLGPWSECSASCGGGVARRTVTCVAALADGTSSIHLGGVPVPDSQCIQDLPAGLSVPSRVVSCGMAPCQDSPCSGDLDCLMRGRCNATGVCDCDAGWAGPRCQNSVRCASGVVNADGSCCMSGVVSPASGQCCAGTSVSRAGECCAPDESVDACGVCGGSGAFIDALGQCCDGLPDAAGMCCPVGVEVDECGVCGGVSWCPVATRVSITAHKPADRRLQQASDALPVEMQPAQLAVFAAALADPAAGTESALLGELVAVTASTGRQSHSPATREWQLAVIGSPQVFGGSAGFDHAIGTSLVAAPLPAAWAEAQVNLAATERQPVCGNGLCEVGEACRGVAVGTSAGAFACCPSDCGLPVAACLTDGAGHQCSGHGTCQLSSGSCQCNTQHGYSGGDCSGCAVGWGAVFVQGGPSKCVLLGAARPAATVSTSVVNVDDDDSGKDADDGAAAEVVGVVEPPSADNPSATPLPSWALALIGGLALVTLVAVGTAIVSWRRGDRQNVVSLVEARPAAAVTESPFALTVKHVNTSTVEVAWPAAPADCDVDSHVVE